MVTADRKKLLSGETLQEAFKLFDKVKNILIKGQRWLYSN